MSKIKTLSEPRYLVLSHCNEIWLDLLYEIVSFFLFKFYIDFTCIRPKLCVIYILLKNKSAHVCFTVKDYNAGNSFYDQENR